MCIGIVISIHALREEGDPPLTPALAMVANFYPRPPRGGRPRRAGYRGQHFAISIHALREEGDGMPLGVEPSQQISIHALREEGDPGRCGQIGETHISIHALREEGDISLRPAVKALHLFLSTPSARRATEGDFLFIGWCCNFYPRPPRGGRRCPSWAAVRVPKNFYPRPPRGGRPQCYGQHDTSK